MNTLFRTRPASIAFTLAALTAMFAAKPQMARGDDPADGPSKLQAQLSKILEGHGQSRARLGAKVADLESGRVLFERNADTPMIPASNMKMVVIAAAIDTLGPSFQYETTLAIRGKDLVVVGSGDPTLGDDQLASARKESITALFHDWAAKLKAAGVKQIPGDLIVDDSIFDREFVHKNWPSDQYQAWYEAPIGGLNFNSNCVSVRLTPGKNSTAGVQLIPGNTQLDIKNSTNASSKQRPAATRLRGADMLLVSGAVNQAIVLGPITVQDPGLFFGATLKTVLAAEDIRVYGEVVRRAVRQADGSLPKDCHVVAVQKTPLGDALARAGKDSLGMAAEAVMKTLGAVRRNRGSWPNGIAVVGEFLRRVGVSEGAATLDDGSGLSRNNRISPEALVAILQYMHRQGGAKLDLFRKSLSHCGVDGSLKKRMKQVKDRVIGKTGYISGVRTLSGYVQPRSGHWLAFSFLYNNCVATRPMTQAQDEACRLLADSTDLK